MDLREKSGYFPSFLWKTPYSPFSSDKMVSKWFQQLIVTGFLGASEPLDFIICLELVVSPAVSNVHHPQFDLIALPLPM